MWVGGEGTPVVSSQANYVNNCKTSGVLSIMNSELSTFRSRKKQTVALSSHSTWYTGYASVGCREFMFGPVHVILSTNDGYHVQAFPRIKGTWEERERESQAVHCTPLSNGNYIRRVRSSWTNVPLR